MSTGRTGGKRSDLILCTGDRGMVWSSTQKWKPRAMAYEITNNVNLSSHAYFIMPNCIYIYIRVYFGYSIKSSKFQWVLMKIIIVDIKNIGTVLIN